MAHDQSPRDPQRRSLHAISRAHLPTFLNAHTLPAFVRDELTGYVAHQRCVRCTIVRRTNSAARDLLTRVLPQVRIRQWVLSVPFELRVRLAFDHDTTPGLWRRAERAIDRRYRAFARYEDISTARGGSLVVVHRAGSDLRLDVHYHALFLDGCFDAPGTFHEAPALTRAELAAEVAVHERDRDRLEQLCRYSRDLRSG